MHGANDDIDCRRRGQLLGRLRNKAAAPSPLRRK
jgi:hypothetical protein